jgi:hypothetical protein
MVVLEQQKKMNDMQRKVWVVMMMMTDELLYIATI